MRRDCSELLPDLIARPPSGGVWLLRWADVILQPLVLGDQRVGVWFTAPEYNQSLAGTLVRLSAPPPAVLVALALTLLVGIAAVAAARPTSAAVPRAALESSVIVLLMLLLSPASSPPHFVALLLPGFCVARLALLERDRRSQACLAAAVICSLVSHRALVGDELGSAALWAGAVTASAACLLVGCVAALRGTAR